LPLDPENMLMPRLGRPEGFVLGGDKKKQVGPLSELVMKHLLAV